jgi:signal transduction histidine kinase/response regulator RpfG family c-di-GMP phosphodiesterase
MRIKHVQYYVVMIMISSSLVMSTIFSLIAYQVNQRLALQESERQVRGLMKAVKNTAAAAIFSKNIDVGQDAINGLLGTQVIYSATLEGYSDHSYPGMHLSNINPAGGSPLTESTLELESLFNKGQFLGVLKVQSNAQWVKQRTRETSIPTIFGVIFVIFMSSLASTQALKVKISKPLAKVSRQLKTIQGDSPERLTLPKHLRPNEIGRLVDGLNELLNETNSAFKTERLLRDQMQNAQTRLQVAKAQAESAAQSKSDFLATMSHEIRTPLSGVLGMLGFSLKDQSLSPRTREYIDIAASNAEALLIIVNDILDLSKIEAGKLTIEKVDFNLKRQVNAALAIFPQLAANKSLQFEFKVDDKVPEFLLGDPTRIRQVLVNFVSNAIKFTHEGSVSILIECITTPEEYSDTQPRIRFTISDTGIGISDANMVKLFKKFEQADVSTTRKFGGSGLGLAISKQLITAMNGTVNVASIVNKGSVFTFELPMEIGEGEADDTENAETKPHSHKLNILCAEDFETNQLIIRTMLENMGHDVEVVENGKLALDKLIKTDYNLVLMDGRMPEMDGIEATQVIRQGLWQDQPLINKQVTIIALTANVTEEDRQRYLAAGMNDFLQKPVDESLLHQMINDTIQQLLDKGVALNPLIRASTTELDKLFAIQPAHESEGISSKTINPNHTSEQALNEKLKEAFIHSLPQRIQEINQARINEDMNELGRLFHGIRGSAGYLDDKALIESASQLEQLADSHNMASATQLYDAFMQQLKTYQTTI